MTTIPRLPCAATIAALGLALSFAHSPAQAQEAPPPLASEAEQAQIVADVIDGHILPRFEALAQTSAHLAKVAQSHCTLADGVPDAPLPAAFGAAFDAWIAASHLRFGPSETDTRAFALAYWPDTRGATIRTLTAMITSEDPVAYDPAAYGEVSIAARGFYAMEALLYHDALTSAGQADYRCALLRAMTRDSAATAAAILAEWQNPYRARMLEDGPLYRNRGEAVQVLYKVLNEGLEFTADTRLGRPLGTFERPQPKRAEAWRAGRSLRHVMISAQNLEDLSLRLAAGAPKVRAGLQAGFDQTLAIGAQLDDPVFAGVSDPTGRLKVEILQQSLRGARDIVRGLLGPRLGVAAGFNALDGD